ncbi:XrtA/PEP-CTERM system TPR-repeat protein PrsT [Motilimonas sp. KMU-193]|uniref:XrtA/PEP-CTERM system TPR-repeat protein PrsT n=1 Tax=Motilimonas sp. KMU-193 TaxID=3388668 RepID=UPI00396B03A1
MSNFALQRLHASIFVLGCALLPACGGPTAKEHQAQANLYIEQQDWPSAAYHLKQSIRQDDKNAATRLQLGLLYLADYQLDAAVKELRVANHLGSEEARVALASAYSWQGNYEPITRLNVAPSLTFEQQAELLMYHIEAALALQQQSVLDWYSKLAAVAPKSLYHHVAKAMILLSEAQPEAALGWLEQALAVQADDQRSLWLQTKTLYTLKRYNEANRSLQQLLTIAPDRVSYYLLAVDIAFAMADLPAAQRYIAEVQKRDPKQPQHIFNQAYLALQQQDFNLALRLSEQILAQGESYPARLVNGISHYYLGNWEQAYGQLQKTVDTFPNQHVVQQLLADTLMKLGKLEQSALILERAQWQQVAQLPLLLSLSSALIEQGSGVTGQRLLEKANRLVETEQNSANKAVVKLLQGDLEQGIAALESSELQGSEQGQQLLFDTYLKAEQWHQAQAIVDAVTSGNQLQGYTLFTRLKLAQQQPLLAEQSLQAAFEQTSQPALLYLLALSQHAQGKWHGAQASLERLANLAPIDQKALSLWVDIDLQLQQPEQAMQRLLATANQPLSLSNQWTLIRLSILQQQAESALSQLAGLSSTHQASAEGLWLSALAHVQLGHWSQAEQHLHNLLASHTLQQKYLALLAHIKLRQQAYEDLLASLLQYPLDQNGWYSELVVRLHIQLGHWRDVELSLARADGLTPLQKSELNAYLALTRGELSRANSAIQSQLAAGTWQPALIDLAYIYAIGQPVKAEKLITNGSGNFADQPDLLEAHAQLAWQRGDTTKAQQNWQRLLQLYPQHIVALNNLAWSYNQLGQVNMALPLIQQAYQLAPQNHQVIDTYATVLMAQSDYQQAIKMLEQISPSQREDVIWLHLAQGYLGLEDYQQAQVILQRFSGRTMQPAIKKQANALQAIVLMNQGI